MNVQIETGLTFIFARLDSISHVPRWRRKFEGRSVKVNRPMMIIVLTQSKEQMFVL